MTTDYWSECFTQNQASHVTHIIQKNYSNKGCQIDCSVALAALKSVKAIIGKKNNVTFFSLNKNIISYFKICKMIVEAKHIIIQAVKKSCSSMQHFAFQNICIIT